MSELARGHILLPSLAAGQIGAFSLMWTRGRHNLVWIFAAGLVIGGWIWFCIWTWRRLARTRDAENGTLIYDFGVLGFGLSMAATMAVVNAARDVGGLANAFTMRFAGSLLQHAVIGFPIFLWGGYLWGRLMGSVFKLPR